MNPVPETRYARAGDISIAYQVVGDAPLDLVIVPGIVSHVEFFHELPSYSRFVERLSSFARVITFDKRGTGLSDRVADAPSYEQRMDDISAVMSAVNSERAALLGISEGGSLGAMFAATYPDRVRAFVAYGAFARLTRAPDYPIGLDAEVLQGADDEWARVWGKGDSIRFLSTSRANDAEARALWGKAERLSMSPGGLRALLRIIRDIDVRCVLSSIRAPTLVLHAVGEMLPAEIPRYLAKHIRGARWVELPGLEHYPWFGDVEPLVAEIEEFLTGSRSESEHDRMLATVLFTDIVGSTERAASLGDRRWRELLDAHDAALRREITRARGREVKTTGDGFFAAFDGPARAVRCAQAIAEQARGLGLEVRAGVHTGECEVRGDDLAGIAVHIGARVAALAGAGEVMVTSTVRDLVAGSGIEFAERGTQRLAGVPGEWMLLRAVAQTR
jgi:class 3 adenylate cyclase/alpha-beta hydrolase superfamily lysophospholipase